jgi:hypothetical protein
MPMTNEGEYPISQKHGISVAFGDNYHDPTVPNFRVNSYHSLKPYTASDPLWLCAAAARQKPVLAEYQPGYEGALIAYQGNMYAIRTAEGLKDTALPPTKPDQALRPSEARLLVDQGLALHSVWTLASAAAGQGDATYGLAWPIPVHHIPGAVKAGQGWKQGGGAGINAVHFDGHVDFYGGRRFELGPGKLDFPTNAWWKHGITADFTESGYTD